VFTNSELLLLRSLCGTVFVDQYNTVHLSEIWILYICNPA